jgi:periplasmic protein TonB
MSFAACLDRRAGFDGHVLRWLMAAALTVLAHGAAVWIILNWRSEAAVAPSEPPPAVMIDLSPLVMNPREPQRDVAVGPQMTEAELAPSDEAARRTVQAAAPDPSPQPPDKPVDEAAPKPPLAPARPERPTEQAATPAASAMEAAADRNPPPPSPMSAAPPSPPPPSPPTDQELSLPPVPGHEAEAAPPPPVVEPEAPQPPVSAASAAAQSAPPDSADAAVRVVPKADRLPAAPAKVAQADQAKPSAAPPPKAQPPLPAKQRVKAESKRIELTKATKPDDRPEASRATAPAASNAPAAKATASAASSSGETSSSALATWKGELVAHINRFKRFPPNAVAAGTASVGFAINRAGSVVSARLIASSGDRVLDEEAIALLHRASPVPPPPAQFGGNVVTLTVPIRFDR